MKNRWPLVLTSCAIGLAVAGHVYFFLHLPSGVALGSGAGIVAALLVVKLVLARIGIHNVLKRIH